MFKTENSTYARVIDVERTAATEALIKSTVYGGVNASVLERGVVYSSEHSNPTLDNTPNTNVKYAALASVGDFELSLTLAPESTYYVRAFVKDNIGYHYSPYVEVNLSKMEEVVTITEKPFATGVGNYMFMPSEPMKRIDVILMLYRLLADENHPYYSNKVFPDMPTSPESINAVNFVVNQGIVEGHDSGYLMPDDPVTRAQISKMINIAFGFQRNNTVSVDLTDIEDHWAFAQIAIGVQNGYIKGYTDKTFKPDNSVSRVEAVVMVSRSAERSLEPLGEEEFIDVPNGAPGTWQHEMYKHIMNAAIPF
jgi:hypothetical protein